MTQSAIHECEILNVSPPSKCLSSQMNHAPCQLRSEMVIEEDKHHPATLSRTASWKAKILWWCDPRQWFRSILLLRDDPHSVALGTSIGVFVGLTPTFGIQMILVLTIAFLTRKLFRFNRFAALIAVYISNPFTMVPIFWANYRLGAVFTKSQVTWEQFSGLFKYNSVSEWFNSFINVFRTLGTPLIVGSLIVATFFALPTYPVMLRLLQRVHERRRLSKSSMDVLVENESGNIS